MKTSILIIVVIAIIGSIIYLQSRKPSRPASEEEQVKSASKIILMDKKEKANQYPPAKEITTPDGFINTKGITIQELIGKKVILVDFWTYSCINCQRTLPYLNQWHEKYKDKGLVIIGVHTPEFQFEQKYENVLAAVKKFGINYPVVLDNDYSTWHAYKNRYWPRKYLIDIDGFIVYDHIGEGGYEETERKIQELLGERMAMLGTDEDIQKGISKPEGVEEVNLSARRSPEIYFGASRNTYLGNGKSNTLGAQTLPEPTGIKTNILYLTGDWEFREEFAENKGSGAKIIFRYQARKVFLVVSSEAGVTIRLVRDGIALEDEAGSDVQENSTVFIKEDRLYRLIEDPEGHGEHTLEIIIENPGLRAFTFTFG